MIGEHILLNTFRHEQNQWKGESQTEFVKGVLHGILICVGHVEALAEERRQDDETYKDRARPWTLGRLYQAIRSARNQIVRVDRRKAIRILEDALKHPIALKKAE